MQVSLRKHRSVTVWAFHGISSFVEASMGPRWGSLLFNGAAMLVPNHCDDRDRMSLDRADYVERIAFEVIASKNASTVGSVGARLYRRRSLDGFRDVVLRGTAFLHPFVGVRICEPKLTQASLCPRRLQRFLRGHSGALAQLAKNASINPRALVASARP